jgi:hypothetical protein
MIVRKILTYFFLLGIFIGLGYWGGKATSVKAREFISIISSGGRVDKQLDYPLPTNITNGSSSQTAQSEIAFKAKRPTAPEQENILVIGVSDLAAPEPELESVWMVLYLTDSTHLTLMPIYPPFMPEISQSQQLAKSFRLNGDRQLDEKFIQALRDQDLRWNYTVVMDQVALSAVVDFVRSSGGGGSNLGRAALDQKASDADTLVEQTRLLQGLCYGVGELPYLPDVSGLYKLIPQHVMTDLPLVEFISAWQIRLAQGSQLSCEFPFLSAQ